MATASFGWKALGWGAVALALSATPAYAQTVKAERLSDTEAVALIEKAKTPADHERLAAYYEQRAIADDQSAKQHKALAAAYRRRGDSGNPRVPSTSASAANHCDSMATAAATGAAEARTMAEHHRMLAKESTR